MSAPTSVGTYDYVIVGAGSAGCVLANRLTQDPAVNVLLLEAGGEDKYWWIHVPVGMPYLLGNKEVDWCLSERARALLRQPHHPGAARQDVGRLVVDQRHVLHPRPRPRL